MVRGMGDWRDGVEKGETGLVVWPHNFRKRLMGGIKSDKGRELLPGCFSASPAASGPVHSSLLPGWLGLKYSRCEMEQGRIRGCFPLVFVDNLMEASV